MDNPITARRPDLIFWDTNGSANHSHKTRSHILKYKWITQSQPEDQTQYFEIHMDHPITDRR